MSVKKEDRAIDDVVECQVEEVEENPSDGVPEAVPTVEKTCHDISPVSLPKKPRRVTQVIYSASCGDTSDPITSNGEVLDKSITPVTCEIDTRPRGKEVMGSVPPSYNIVISGATLVKVAYTCFDKDVSCLDDALQNDAGIQEDPVGIPRDIAWLKEVVTYCSRELDGIVASAGKTGKIIYSHRHFLSNDPRYKKSNLMQDDIKIYGPNILVELYDTEKDRWGLKYSDDKKQSFANYAGMMRLWCGPMGNYPFGIILLVIGDKLEIPEEGSRSEEGAFHPWEILGQYELTKVDVDNMIVKVDKVAQQYAAKMVEKK